MTTSLDDLIKSMDQRVIDRMVGQLKSADFGDVTFAMGHYPREVIEAIAGEASRRLIPSLLKAAPMTMDNVQVSISDAGAVRTVLVSKAKTPYLEIEIKAHDEHTEMSVRSEDEDVFTGFLFGETREDGHGRVNPRKLQTFVDLFDVLRPFVKHWGVPDVQSRYSMFPAVAKAAAFDGVLPATNTWALLRHVLCARAKAFLPTFASRIVENAKDLSDLGCVWEKQFICYSAKRAVFVPRGGSHLSVACFHENIGLLNDYSSFLVVVDVDTAGAPLAIRCHAFQRWKDDRVAVINAFIAEGSEPEPMFEYDVRTGELKEESLIRDHDNTDYLPFIIRNDRSAIEVLQTGDLDGYDLRVRTDFDDFVFEPLDDEDFDDE